MPGEKFESSKPYLSIVEGSLRQKVAEGHPEAIRREYAKDGVTKVYYELRYKSWSGRITDLRVKDGPFGEMLEIVFDDAILTLNTQSRYFSDFAKKIVGADINEKVILSPYDFESKQGKKVIGMGVMQSGGKLKSYFWDNDKEESINGFPVPEGDTKSFKKDDWKIFYMIVKKFLVKELEKVKSKIVADDPEKDEIVDVPEQEAVMPVAEEEMVDLTNYV